MPYAAKNLKPEVRRIIERRLLDGLSCRRVAAELQINYQLVAEVRKGLVAPKTIAKPLESDPRGTVTSLAPASSLAPTPPKPKRDKARVALQQYQRQLRKRMPLKTRALALSSLAKKWKSQPAIAMKALEQIDKIDGFAQQARENGGGGMPPLPAAMFILPPGSSAVGIRMPGPTIELSPESSSSSLSAADAADEDRRRDSDQ